VSATCCSRRNEGEPMADAITAAITAAKMLEHDCTALLVKIKPLLAGKSAKVHGMIVAELASIWLAGHIVEGDPAATERLRKNLLSVLTRTIREMTPINAALMGV